jgi:hypothetical protein
MNRTCLHRVLDSLFLFHSCYYLKSLVSMFLIQTVIYLLEIYCCENPDAGALSLCSIYPCIQRFPANFMRANPSYVTLLPSRNARPCHNIVVKGQNPLLDSLLGYLPSPSLFLMQALHFSYSVIKLAASQSRYLRRSTVITSQVPPVDWVCGRLAMPRHLLLAQRPRRGRWW